MQEGSSPRMRGTRSPMLTQGLITRIIPADAGNTNIIAAYGTPDQDHPRGCGEHLNHENAFVASSGSSPRMRGTLAADCSRLE